MPGFTHLVVQQDRIKDMVYTPIGYSPTISVMVYAQFGSSPLFSANVLLLFLLAAYV